MTPLRWRFPDGSEDDARAQVTNLIDAWWRAFEAKLPDLRARLSGKVKWDLPAWIEENLEVIGPGLFWEFGPGLKARHRLVITSEAHRHARPLVNEIVRRAPKLEGFEFYSHRLAEQLSDVARTVEGRTGVPLASLSARAEADRFGKVALTYYGDDPDDTLKHAAFVATESIFGEQVLDRWIGAIDVVSGHGLPLAQLKPAVETLIGRRQASLPAAPVYSRIGEAEWSLLELEPTEAEDYFGQQDLRVGKSVDVEMFENARCGATFDSQRFSRCGEVFAYLKTDGTKWPLEGRFPDKASIEDALDDVLISRGLGCQIGGGTGLRYAYVDLALTDVDAAVPFIVQRMRAGKLPKRSWIQFFDSDLQWEWVGIWPDSPPPPLPPAE